MDEDFQTYKVKIEALYKGVGSQYCPYLNSPVFFNNLGWDHLCFKDKVRARPVDEQLTRPRLFRSVREVLRKSGTLQGIRSKNEWERIKSHGKWIEVYKTVTYYEFISVIENYRMKVIIKSVEGGQKIFWSVIPAWKFNKITQRRILFD